MLHRQHGPHAVLSFTEASIVSILSNATKDRDSFIDLLQRSIDNTTDPILLREAQGVLEKLSHMTAPEFQALIIDAEQHRVRFPPNYRLPHEETF